MNHRFVSAPLALACLVGIGASVPAQAGDLGAARLRRPSQCSASQLLGLEARTLQPSPRSLGAARTSAVCRSSDAAVPASALLSCSMRGGSASTKQWLGRRRDHPPPSCEPRSASPNHDGISELKGRGDVPQRLYRLPRPANGERAKIEDTAQNRLAHVHALYLRHVDFCRVPLHQPCLVDDSSIGHCDLGAEPLDPCRYE
jgi:hypothetical protein